MGTDKELLVKGLKFVGYTVALMFLAPFVLYQAFKNQEHAAYIPVLIVGLILAIVAIAMGFYTIKIFMDSLFGKKNKN
ncbi:DUF6095 family protein [Flagellimonas sp. S3867]|uniref:DUF6095 family protein n=1 Tax=Flagellimonas sp. S3867 TaxID=2768063 RepID=UPI001687B3CA|nr:DUF6095 family protein [Flagellimonas sp. S3867]